MEMILQQVIDKVMFILLFLFVKVVALILHLMKVQKELNAVVLLRMKIILKIILKK